MNRKQKYEMGGVDKTRDILEIISDENVKGRLFGGSLFVCFL